MPAIVDSIRLAPLGQKGANLYNSYHLLTQLVGLYHLAGDLDRHELAKAFWEEQSGSVIDDLGAVYGLWDQIARGPKVEGDTSDGKDDVVLGEVIARACKRTSKLIGLMTEWTLILRWAEIMRLSERRWQGIVQRLATERPMLEAALRPIRTASLDRSSRLTGLIETYRRESLAMRAASGHLLPRASGGT